MLFGFVCLVVLCVILQAQVLAQKVESESAPAVEIPAKVPTPVTNKRADRTLQQAYSDTFKLLSTANDCSTFYGGPGVALTVLNEFFRKLRKEKLPENVTFTMSGKAINVLNLEVRARFRLFDQTVLNESGSFYVRSGPKGIRIPNIGPFLPATRSSRALTLLHELGHLIRSPSGEWLLQDDGDNFKKSRQNTDTVEKACRSQLKALR